MSRVWHTDVVLAITDTSYIAPARNEAEASSRHKRCVAMLNTAMNLSDLGFDDSTIDATLRESSEDGIRLANEDPSSAAAETLLSTAARMRPRVIAAIGVIRQAGPGAWSKG